MNNIEYNPFEKSGFDLDEEELRRLINNKISEGWYIEYKSQIPLTSSGNLDNLKICKSISSFANTKGGWIFWGVECQNNEATKLCGIDISGYKNFQDQVSQIISGNISPPPIIHFKEIVLKNEKIVFVIQVESGPTPPYITSQGIIYQRENNESKPVKERYIIEKLNEKTTAYFASIEKFSQFELGETKGQADADNPFLEIYLFPKPFDSYSFENFYESDFFKKVAAHFYTNDEFTFDFEKFQSSISLNLGFNSIYFSGDSIVIRPLSVDNMIYKHTTVELFRNGNLKFVVPLHEFNIENIPERYMDSSVLKYILRKYNYNNNFNTDGDYEPEEDMLLGLPLISHRDIKNRTLLPPNIKFIDGTEVIFTMLILISKYKNVLKDNKYDFETPIGFRVRLTSIWRRFVFFDSADYLEKIKLYNIPLTPKNVVEIPSFEKGKSLSINLSDDYAPIDLARFVLEGIGLPDAASLNFWEIIENGIRRFTEKNNDVV